MAKKKVAQVEKRAQKREAQRLMNRGFSQGCLNRRPTNGSRVVQHFSLQSSSSVFFLHLLLFFKHKRAGLVPTSDRQVATQPQGSAQFCMVTSVRLKMKKEPYQWRP